MKTDELPSRPTIPELVLSEAKNKRGLDLLGLRAPAERISNSLMDAVTTVTPNVRYFSLRCWIILRYLNLGGLNDWNSFSRFASRIEAAIAFGCILADTPKTGVIGRDGATNQIKAGEGPLTLNKLTKILATSVYGGPADAMGLGSTEGQVPGLTRERGLPLAEAFDRIVSNDEVIQAIRPDQDDPKFSRDQLTSMGKRLTMSQPSDEERGLLAASIVPDVPRKNELNRIATYCLLLHLCRKMGREVTEANVFDAASAVTLDDIPKELHVACDGWTRFAVRDLLVLGHETAVDLAIRELDGATTAEKRLPLRQVIAALVSDGMDEVLAGAGFDALTADAPISDLHAGVLRKLGTINEVRGLRRWDGPLRETVLIEQAKWFRTPGGMALIPVAWIVAAYRTEPGLISAVGGADPDGGAGAARIGIASVVLPEVRRWSTNSATIRETVSWLIHRSVDQHLRIAWSRLAREPHKDVSLLQSDGEDWIHLRNFRSGRPTSRIYQAINWLGQLGFLSDKGLTEEGKATLDRGLAILNKCRGEAL